MSDSDGGGGGAGVPPEIELIIKASTIDGRRKAPACSATNTSWICICWPS